MTDSEILDYLQAAKQRSSTRVFDVQIGSVYFTVHCHLDEDIRVLLTRAIEADQQRLANKVAYELTRR